MKFKFDPNINYQVNAINSVVDIFEGNRTSTNSIAENYDVAGTIVTYKTISNQLNLEDEEILYNLKKVQKRNEIEQNDLNLKGMNFTIEMETGTGKTYVYLRTIMELNKSYGMTKFIIVVPSVAIREGVNKTLEITEEHFKNLYDNVIYNYYEYDSSNLTQLKQFAYSNNIEIMIMTIDSFNKESNVINKYNDKVEGQKPIELIQETNPILILDEPQNMESDISKKALASLNPLFKLRYSATHRNHYNLVYRLTPVEAYKKGLVKRIEVLSIIEDDDYNNAFIRVKKIKVTKNKGPKAKIEIYKKLSSGIKTGIATVYGGDDLYDKSNGIEEYHGLTIKSVNALHDKEIKLSDGTVLKVGDEQGTNRKELMKLQIEKTIEEHFRKQYRLKDEGIKVLSLFFIDRVDNYVKKDGFIKKTFIETYNRIKNRSEKWAKPYKDLDVNKVHDGYFAKKDDGEYYNDSSVSYMQKNKESYELIMKNKEKLLSFEEPVQFIFSHSALREGWDNPNVFNICTLNQSYSEIKKRQEIGRGVRIPVNQNGKRIFDIEDKPLTVIANESYRDYVAKLQTQYNEEFGENTEAPKPDNKKNKIKVNIKEETKFDSKFKELWKRISNKTKYKISFNSDNFKEECIKLINKINIGRLNYTADLVSLDLDEEKDSISVEGTVKGSASIEKDSSYKIKNFLPKIARETKLTRKTIIEILNKVDNLKQIFNNPYRYVSEIIKIINRVKNDLLIEKIEYFKIDDKYDASLFKEFKSDKSKLIKVENSIYDYIKWDSDAEKKFAKQLDKENNRIKLFIKLPYWFKINTPIGTYNPDWAIVVEDKGLYEDEKNEELYLVRETKSVKNKDDLKQNLRHRESKKIKCGKKHFEEILKEYSDSNYKIYNIDKEALNFDELIKGSN